MRRPCVEFTDSTAANAARSTCSTESTALVAFSGSALVAAARGNLALAGAVTGCVLAGVLFGVIAPPASAKLTALWYRDWRVAFRGAGCQSESNILLSPGSGAFDVSAVKPEVGAVLMDEFGTAPVARVTAVTPSEDDDGNPAILYSAVGSDDVCDNPDDYPDGWTSEDVLFRIDFSRRENLYFNEFYAEGDKTYTRQRPRWIHGGSDFGWSRIHWFSWGGRTARGRGIFYWVEKNPGRYVTHRYRVNLALSKIGACYGRLRYLRQVTTFKAGARVFGRRGPRKQSRNLTCAHGAY